MYVTTREQREALADVYARTQQWPKPLEMTYLQFRRTVTAVHHMDCLIVPFGSMWLGIERDGYTHS
jgi:hypothetical protein